MQKENIRLEFKEARTALPDNLFDTVCAMLTRDGGDTFLGVDDDGHITGIDPRCDLFEKSYKICRSCGKFWIWGLG